MISRTTTWQKLLEQRCGTPFIGRVHEQELFRLNFLYQVPTYLIFALHGPDGVGKSTLLTQYRTIAKEHNAVTVYVDATQATAVREQTILQTMSELAQQFAKAGTPFTAFEERYEEYTTCLRIVAEDFQTAGGVFDLLGGISEMRETQADAWDKYLFQRFGNPTKIALVKTPLETLTQIFVKDMNAWATVRSIILCFDDWEQLGPHLQSWLQGLLTSYEMRTNIWLVFAGTHPLDATWAAFRPVTASFALAEFTEEETRAYLTGRGMSDSARMTDILNFSTGLPALVSLLASAEGGRAGDLALTPADRYLKWLEPSSLRDAVLQCATARRLDADVIQIATDGTDPTFIAWLLKSPLIVHSTGYLHYHPELRRRLLNFAQQQALVVIQAAHARLQTYYLRRSADDDGAALYQDARWRVDRLEALYHGLMLNHPQTIQIGVETFLKSLHTYYPLAAEIVKTWQEAAAAQLRPNAVGEWSDALQTMWQAFERRDWEAVITLCQSWLQREDVSAPAQAEIRHIHQLVLARLGRSVPTPTALPAPAAEAGVPTLPGEPAEPIPSAVQESIHKEMPVKTVEVKHKTVAPTFEEIVGEPQPVEERETKAMPAPHRQIKETPVKDESGTPVMPKVKPEVGAPQAVEPRQVAPELPGETESPVEVVVLQAPPAEEVAVTPAAETRVAEQIEMPSAEPVEVPAVTPEPEGRPELAEPPAPEIPAEPPVSEEALPSAEVEMAAEAVVSAEAAAPTLPSPVFTPALDHHRRATIYLGMGEYEKAIRECQQALEIDPAYAAAYYDRGLAYASLQQYEAAIADFDQVIALDPQHADAYYNRGLVYARQNAWEQALADYDQAITLHPEDALFYNSRGNVYYKMKNYARALADYDQAIQYNPTYVDAYLNRGLTYAALEEYQHAIADYNQTLALDPDNAVAYNYRGQAYARLQQYARALEDYTQAIARDPQYAVAYNNRGLCYVRLGNYAQAIAEYRQAVIANPQYATAYYNAACAAGLMNNAGIACTWLEKAIALNPRYRTMAQRDSDFEYIRGNKKFQALLVE